MKMLQSKKLMAMATLIGAVLLLACEPAMAEDIFDRVQAITNKAGILKTGIVVLGFIVGLIFSVKGGMGIITKSNRQTENDLKWSHVLLMFFGGAVLMGITVTSDIARSTLFGASATTNQVQLNGG